MQYNTDKGQYQNYLKDTTTDFDERSDDYQKYVISAYPYFRSRLLVPGRCHEDDDHGSLAIGGSAHVDLIDLDIWLSKQNDLTRLEALDWINGSSLEQTAYYRGLGKSSKSTIKRRRDKIAAKRSKSNENATFTK